MIEVAGVTKDYGFTRVVNDVSFIARRGAVTGLLGPECSGKSTTMRLIAGLEPATAGSITVGNRAWEGNRAPVTVLGTDLDAAPWCPGLTVREQLFAMAEAYGIPRGRVAEVLELTGTESAAECRAGALRDADLFRLGVARALLGDPGFLLLDEPTDGREVEDIAWLRAVTRFLTARGKAVLIASSFMSVLEQTADQVVVMREGKVVADRPVSQFRPSGVEATVRIHSTDDERLRKIVKSAGVRATLGYGVEVMGMPAESVAVLALGAGIAITGVSDPEPSLADVYLDLLEDAK